MSSKVIGFYKGLSPDSEGRMLIDIQKWNFDKLEDIHDYIQWLFPLTKESCYNPNAPILSTEDIAEFKISETIRTNLIVSFDLLLSFYGFITEKNSSQIIITSQTSKTSTILYFGVFSTKKSQ